MRTSKQRKLKSRFDDIVVRRLDPSMARGASSVNPSYFCSTLEANRSDTATRHDAVQSLIPSRNVEQVLSEILRDDFGPRWSSRYIPMGPFGWDPWADRVIQPRLSRQGLIDYVTSADMPTGDVSRQEITHKLYTLGGKAEMSWFEMQTANYAGVNVMQEKLTERKEAAEDAVDMILLQGDAGLPKGGGFIPNGLINHPDVPTATLTTGNWAGATAAQIISDVMGLVTLFRQQSLRSEEPDTLLVPEASYAILEATQVPNTNMTIRSWLLANVDGLKTISVLPQLAAAGTGGANRVLLFASNDRVLRGVIPMPFGFIMEEMSKLRTYIWGVLRLAGLIIRKPFALVYGDGA